MFSMKTLFHEAIRGSAVQALKCVIAVGNEKFLNFGAVSPCSVLVLCACDSSVTPATVLTGQVQAPPLPLK